MPRVPPVTTDEGRHAAEGPPPLTPAAGGGGARPAGRVLARRGHGDLLLIESHGGRQVVASEQSAHGSYSALSNGWIFLHLKLT